MIEWLLVHGTRVHALVSPDDQGVIYILPLLKFFLCLLLDLTTRCEGDSVSLCESFFLLVQAFVYHDDIRDDVAAFKTGVWSQALLTITTRLWVYTLGLFFVCLFVYKFLLRYVLVVFSFLSFTFSLYVSQGVATHILGASHGR
jgi:hypothetical protein